MSRYIRHSLHLTTQGTSVREDAQQNNRDEEIDLPGTTLYHDPDGCSRLTEASESFFSEKSLESLETCPSPSSIETSLTKCDVCYSRLELEADMKAAVVLSETRKTKYNKVSKSLDR